jgi:hypothetical protein
MDAMSSDLYHCAVCGRTGEDMYEAPDDLKICHECHEAAWTETPRDVPGTMAIRILERMKMNTNLAPIIEQWGPAMAAAIYEQLHKDLVEAAEEGLRLERQAIADEAEARLFEPVPDPRLTTSIPKDQQIPIRKARDPRRPRINKTRRPTRATNRTKKKKR